MRLLLSVVRRLIMILLLRSRKYGIDLFKDGFFVIEPFVHSTVVFVLELQAEVVRLQQIQMTNHLAEELATLRLHAHLERRRRVVEEVDAARQVLGRRR